MKQQIVAALAALAVIAAPMAASAKSRAPKYSTGDMLMPAARAGAPLSAAGVFKSVAPSIYLIVAAKNAETMKRMKTVYEGSAVAITPNLALTNCHIVKRRKTIILAQNKRIGAARVVASDNKTDRCIIAAADMVLNPVPGVRRYDDIAVGEKVYTIGNPSGLEETLGEGIVSGLRSMAGVRYVQTSAPISPGSSGGGLFDERGNLLGITAFMVRDAENLNFAIAAEDYWAHITVPKKKRVSRRSRGGEALSAE